MAVFVVGAAIVDSLTNPTQLLAAQRSYPDALAGQWEFPGGKAEPGEVPEEALHREIREELGAALILGPRILAPATGLASITTSAGTSGDWSIPVGRMRVWLAENLPGITGTLRPVEPPRATFGATRFHRRTPVAYRRPSDNSQITRPVFLRISASPEKRWFRNGCEFRRRQKPPIG